ncbi:signal peptide peptidase SppA [Penaeicola halotolerans]|uniref:signal peptide peptidase SppA n=1 Tax=Penaeicola halotolerans TaxID=2793196 RepID=UPI001CF8DEC8|nr:signal peptide peptidase SppA [Penaeicola halotolerans]
MKFLGNVLAVIVGLIIFNMIAFFLFFGIIGIMASSKEEVKVKANSVLHLDLNKIIVDRPVEDMDFPSPFPGLIVSGQISVLDVKKAIKRAAENDNIKGIYLETGFLSGLPAIHKEIRDELLAFKASGKFITTYAEIYNENGYYVASVADDILLNPKGGMEFDGFTYEAVFFKGTLDKLEVKPEIFRVGDFKSAVEPYLLTEMSEASAAQTKSYLSSLYNQFLQDVSESRDIPVATLQSMADNLSITNAQSALDNKLVTQLAYADQKNDLLREKLGLGESDKIELISMSKFLTATDKFKSSNDQIALIVAEGEIVSGNVSDGTIGSEAYAKMIREAANDDKIKAIVLRINSPGGSALASDVMWRELQLAKEKKPVIASMSDVAASGGYYIAVAADTIVAQPNTITGSIGIFGMFFNAQDFLKNKLGVTTDHVNTAQHSDMFSMTRELTKVERDYIQSSINEGYENFTQLCADGRGMSLEELKSIASGRVWSGTEAKERGLVDILGGLDDALAIAAEKANIGDDYGLRVFPAKQTFVEKILESFGGNIEARYMQHKLGDLYPIVQQAEKIKQMEGIQARMPYQFSIK